MKKVKSSNILLIALILVNIFIYFYNPSSTDYIDEQMQTSKVISTDSIEDLAKAKSDVINKIIRDEIITNKRILIDSLEHIIFVDNIEFAKKIDPNLGAGYYHSNKKNLDYIILIEEDYNTLYHELMHYIDRRSKKSATIDYERLREVKYAEYFVRLAKFFNIIQGDSLIMEDQNLKYITISLISSDMMIKNKKFDIFNNNTGKYFLKNAEIYANLNIFANFLRDRGIIKNIMTEEELSYITSGEMFKNLNELDKNLIVNNPDIFIYIPLINKNTLNIINKII